ncbi:MAG: M48 family metalloprotease [Saprospiraceae bacterium]|nr:M48 family metalloprotease [Saprospiraceae bacterium]
MNFRSNVRLVESALINVPVVIGYLKPMILMPIGLVNQLTIYQVEAILAHELAHIKRYDYLMNLVQSVIETILFFHPAVWWISGEIRRERENCCDDLALRITDSITFAKALANVEQFRSNFINKRKPQLSMAALTNKNQLLNRVQRILNQPQKNRSSLKGLFAACILIVSFIATSLDAQRVEIQENLDASKSLMEVMTQETAKPDFPMTIVKDNEEFPTTAETEIPTLLDIKFPEN